MPSSSVIQKFLDTPHMQRLKGLKQLGTADYVFINTNHTRFEHSLGVAELGRTLVSKIARAQPCLLCTPSDKLCVELGALMHDIGHGPFSHHYERFVDEQRKLSTPPPDHIDLPPIPRNWCHEDASLMMVDAVLFHLGYTINLDQLDEPLQTVRCNIEPLLAEDGTALTNRDFVFVKEVIVGQPIDQIEAKLGPGFHGRPRDHQEWLYDIVANRRHGLDVDKIDYFARDQRRALRESGEIDKIMIEEAVVAWAQCPDSVKCFRCADDRPQKHLMICYPKKLISSCMDFFKTRFTLHSKSELLICPLIQSVLTPRYPLQSTSIKQTTPFRLWSVICCAKPTRSSKSISVRSFQRNQRVQKLNMNGCPLVER